MQRLISLFIILLVSSPFVYAQPAAQNLTAIGHWDNESLPAIADIAYNDAWGWADTTNGREYAIVGTLGYTYFVDITDPANPVPVDSVQGAFPGAVHRDLKTYRHYCYGVADEGTNSTLQIIDMSYLPDSVHVVYDTNAWFSRAHNIYIEEATGRMYVVGTRTLRLGAFVFDIATNPAQPILIGNTTVGEYSHDLYVRGDTAYMNNGGNGMKVFDYANPGAPVPIGAMPFYANQGYNHSCWLSEDGNHLVMADETHNIPVKVVDVANLSNISVVSEFKSAQLAPADTASIPHNPLVRGNYAVVSYYHDGVQIFDISNPAAPVQFAWYDTDTVSTNYGGYKGCWGVYPFLPSGNIIATDVLSGLWVLRPDFPFPSVRTSATSFSDALCAGTATGTATVNAGGGTGNYAYLWSTGDTTAAISGLTSGTYTVTTTDQLGYTTMDTVTINEPLPLQNTLTATGESCAGNANGTLATSPTGGVGGYTYLWSNGATSANVAGLPTGAYTVTVTDSNGCQLAMSGTVPLSFQTPVAFAGPDTNICAGNMVLGATLPTLGTGAWTFLSGSGSVSNPAFANSPVTGLPGGTTQLVWTVTNGPCQSADTLEIFRQLLGTANAGPDDTICQGQYVLNGLAPTTGAGAWTLINGSGAFAANADPNSPVSGLSFGANTFEWTITAGNCEERDTVTVYYQDVPTAGFTFVQTGNTVQFTNQSTNGTTYYWDFGDGGFLSTVNPSHTYFVTGSFTACLITSNVCGSDTSCQPISVATATAVPNSFTEWEVYPNPSNGKMTLRGEAVGEISIRMVDLAGKTVQKWPAFLANGQFAMPLDSRGVPAGIYLMEIQTPTHSFAQKIIVQP